MRCSDIRPMLEALADSTASAAQRAAAERHVAECTACAAELSDLAATVCELRQDVALEPPPGLRDSIMRQVMAAPLAPAAAKSASWLAGATAVKAAAGVLLAAGAIAVLTLPGRGTVPAPLGPPPSVATPSVAAANPTTRVTSSTRAFEPIAPPAPVVKPAVASRAAQPPNTESAVPDPRPSGTPAPAPRPARTIREGF